MNNICLNRFFLYFFGIFLLLFTQCTKEKVLILSDEKEILDFKIQGISHVLRQEGQLLNILLYEPLDLSQSYTPLIVVSGFATVSPHSESPQLFSYTDSIKYTVTAQSGNTKVFFVKVHENLITNKTILNFTIPNKSVNVLFDEQKIQIEVYHNVDVTSLIPIITIPSGATISPSSGEAVDFSNPVTYTVTAQDGSTAEYSVAVNKNLSRKNDIESFQFAGTEQIFEREGDNLFVYVPYETDITNIKANVAVSDMATVNPASGTYMNFTTPQIYTVTASDGTNKEYTITVKKSPWRNVIKNGEAPFLKADGHRLVVFKDKMWLLGGWLGKYDNDKGNYNNGYDYYSSQIWCTSDGVNWESKGNAPWREGGTVLAAWYSIIKYG